MTVPQQVAYDWTGRVCAVTGAAGFIGRSLCELLRSKGAFVYGLSRQPVDTSIVSEWRQCDVTDLDQVRSVVSACKPEIVFHLASQVTGARSLDLVLPTMHANLGGFLHVSLVAAEVGCRRIVCMGSLQEPDTAAYPVPCSPYAAAKFAASCYARMLVEVFDLPVVIARPLMVYGAGQLDFTKLVPHVVSRLLQGQVARLSSGRHPFDWVYIADVCDALLAIAAAPDVVGRTLDIGNGVLTPVADVARGIAARLGSEEALELGVLPDRRGEPVRAADIETTARLTGWRPRIDIDTGLDQTVEWYRRLFQEGGPAGLPHPAGVPIDVNSGLESR